MQKTIRNLIIFTIVAVGGGFVGVAVNRLNPPQDPMQGLGTLIWLVSPLAVSLLLRALAGDGWKDFGIAFQLKASWRWYLATPIMILLVSLIPLGLGMLVGTLSIAPLTAQMWNSLLVMFGTGLVGSMVKNIFEEFAWRGYLTPRFAALKLHPILNALFTGLIWASWHIPYYLYFFSRQELQKYTPLSIPAFILVAFLILPLQAFAYGELRLLSKSVWPAWLLHTLANAATLALISSGFVTIQRDLLGVLFSPGTDGLLHSLLMGVIGFGLWQVRRRQNSREAAI